jgi:hypothetical protein
LLYNGPNTILSKLNKEDATEPTPEAHVEGSSKVLGVHFQHTPINLNKDMEDVEEIDGMSTQLGT